LFYQLLNIKNSTPFAVPVLKSLLPLAMNGMREKDALHEKREMKRKKSLKLALIKIVTLCVLSLKKNTIFTVAINLSNKNKTFLLIREHPKRGRES